MPVTFANALRDQITDDLANALNTLLGSAAVIEFFDGTMPGTCEAGDDGTELASLSLPNPVWGTPSANVFQTSSITPGSVTTNGTCQYWRMKDNADTCILQGTAAVGSGGSIIFNSVSWTAAQSLAIDFIIFTISIGGSP